MEITKIALKPFSRMQTFLAYLKTQNCALLICIEMLLIVCLLIVFLNFKVDLRSDRLGALPNNVIFCKLCFLGKRIILSLRGMKGDKTVHSQKREKHANGHTLDANQLFSIVFLFILIFVILSVSQRDCNIILLYCIESTFVCVHAGFTCVTPTPRIATKWIEGLNK